MDLTFKAKSFSSEGRIIKRIIRINLNNYRIIRAAVRFQLLMFSLYCRGSWNEKEKELVVASFTVLKIKCLNSCFMVDFKKLHEIHIYKHIYIWKIRFTIKPFSSVQFHGINAFTLLCIHHHHPFSGTFSSSQMVPNDEFKNSFPCLLSKLIWTTDTYVSTGIASFKMTLT